MVKLYLMASHGYPAGNYLVFVQEQSLQGKILILFFLLNFYYYGALFVHDLVVIYGRLNNVRLGKIVHDTMLLMDFNVDMFVASSLIKLYAENGYIQDAQHLFDEIP